MEPNNTQAPTSLNHTQDQDQVSLSAQQTNMQRGATSPEPQTAPTPSVTPQAPQTSIAGNSGPSKESLWYVDNYVLLKDYYDRTISRIAARCVRMGNIAMEEYPFYAYILDVLEEISTTGDYILEHSELYPYVEKKIAGGLTDLKKTLLEYQEELRRNSSPDMIKKDEKEIEKMKEALGEVSVAEDPTLGAGMNMDELMDKLMQTNQTDPSLYVQADTVKEEPPAQEMPAHGGLKKVLKIKKPVSAEANVAVPSKEEGI